MISPATIRWLKEKNIVLEEDFGTALIDYAECYKKKCYDQYEGYLCPFGSQLAGNLQMA